MLMHGCKKARGKVRQGRQEKERNPEKADSDHDQAVKRRKEKFDLDRMTATTGRSGVPFVMARDIANKVSKQSRSEAKGKSKKIVTAGRVGRMIADELHDRNQQAAASSYVGEAPENPRHSKPGIVPYESPIGIADSDQHNACRAKRDSVMHDKSKRVAFCLNMEQA